MYKKLLSLMVLLGLLTSLTACGGGSEPPAAPEGGTPAPTATP